MLFTASVQVEHPIFAEPARPAVGRVRRRRQRRQQLDATCEPVLGYGVGVHWRSPVGPLRVDLAYGQEVKRVRLHFSVGVSF